jgi:ankyrin repeat protein
LISQGADVNGISNPGQTPLHTVAGGDKDCPELCEILLKHGASINVIGTDGNQPLHGACSTGHARTVGVLVAQGADVNAFNEHGQTPLHTAAGGRNDCPELCEILLKHGASINAMGKDGNQPLHGACSTGHARTVTEIWCKHQCNG